MRREKLSAWMGGWRPMIAGTALAAALAFTGALSPAQAQEKVAYIGISMPLTGADALTATRIRDGALMAVKEANEKGGVAGYKIETIVLDSGTATAGQYDPAQAATNAKKFVADSRVVAAIGPVMSAEGTSEAGILSCAHGGSPPSVVTAGGSPGPRTSTGSAWWSSTKRSCSSNDSRWVGPRLDQTW